MDNLNNSNFTAKYILHYILHYFILHYQVVTVLLVTGLKESSKKICKNAPSVPVHLSMNTR